MLKSSSRNQDHPASSRSNIYTRQHRQLVKICFIILTAAMVTSTGAKPLARLCTDTEPIDILALSIASSSGQMNGMEVVNVDDKRGYRFDPEARLFGVDAAAMMTKCQFFPSEFSLVVSFLKDGPRNSNEYLLTLLAPDRRSILLGVRLQREVLSFDYLTGGGGVGGSATTAAATTMSTASFRDEKLIDGKWHTITIAVAGKYITFSLDCVHYKAVEGEKMKNAFPSKLAVYPNSKFHIASRRSRRNRFTGLLSQFYMVPGADISSAECSSTSFFDHLIASVLPTSAANKLSNDAQFLTYIDKEDGEQALACDVKNRGQLVYREKMGGLEMCGGEKWKKLAKTNEKLDYVVEYSDLTTKSKSLDVEVFELPGHGLFLASANQGRDKNMNSTIFKWREGRFQPYQNITTDNARHWKHFNIGTEHFLAVANHGSDDEAAEAQSKLYRWKEDQKRFVLHQYIRTFSARCFESFRIDGKTYLVVANYAKNDHKGMSWIFVWDEDERAFIKYQPLDTVGAYDFEYFKVGSEHYLALANSFNGVTTNLHSVIYRWRSSSFIPHQYIETIGATDMEHFKIDGVNYLAIANYYDHGPKSNQVNSTIYRYRERKKLFEKLQDIPTNGALDFEFFTVGSDSFLIAASSGDTSKHPISEIYRWQGVEGFVSVHKIPTHPCADWESFTTEQGQRFLVSANSENRHSKILQLLTY